MQSKETRPGWGGAHNVCELRVYTCWYHVGVNHNYVHVGYITQALYCRIIRVLADLLNVFTCSINHHTTGPEHLMSTVEKKTVSLYSITM